MVTSLLVTSLLLYTIFAISTQYYHHITTPIDGEFTLNKNDLIYHSESDFESRDCEFTFGNDGNLVLQDITMAKNDPDRVLWASGTDTLGLYVYIKYTGNIEIHDDNGMLWESGTSGHSATQPHQLCVEFRCTYLMDNALTVLWSKGDGCDAVTSSPSTPTSVTTSSPTYYPTNQPTILPTVATEHPTTDPSAVPTSATPSDTPTRFPTKLPTDAPLSTGAPTDSPLTTGAPSDFPTTTDAPLTTGVPTDAPTDAPLATDAPLTTDDPLTTGKVKDTEASVDNGGDGKDNINVSNEKDKDDILIVFGLTVLSVAVIAFLCTLVLRKKKRQKNIYKIYDIKSKKERKVHKQPVINRVIAAPNIEEEMSQNTNNAIVEQETVGNDGETNDRYDMNAGEYDLEYIGDNAYIVNGDDVTKDGEEDATMANVTASAKETYNTNIGNDEFIIRGDDGTDGHATKNAKNTMQ